jgi:hypothetical protein
LYHHRCLALQTQLMRRAQQAVLVASTVQHPAGAMAAGAWAWAAGAATLAATRAATQVAITHTQRHASTGEAAAADRIADVYLGSSSLVLWLDVCQCPTF